MSAVPPWFERKFEFSFPTTHYPNLLVRLRGTPARLEEIFRHVPSERRVCRPGPNKWSAQEHAGHLLDLEPLWLARVEDFVGGRDGLTVADLNNRKTHDANHNVRLLEEILIGFRGARQELVNRVGKLAPEVFSRTLMHPRLQQPMRLVDHLYFVAEHDDHHLATIWELNK
jgi:uncharacterized damage-inducible protein DinB